MYQVCVCAPRTHEKVCMLIFKALVAKVSTVYVRVRPGRVGKCPSRFEITKLTLYAYACMTTRIHKAIGKAVCDCMHCVGSAHLKFQLFIFSCLMQGLIKGLIRTGAACRVPLDAHCKVLGKVQRALHDSISALSRE